MVTEVTTQSWGSRLMDSIKNVVFGIVLFLLSIGLLWWNEGNAVKKYNAINETRNSLVSVSADSISKVNEGKPVHVTGKAETEENLIDPEFKVAANAIRLRRIVEMYQWQENQTSSEKKNVGGSTEKTVDYTYDKVWSTRLIKSSDFKDSGYNNPTVMQPEGWTAVADKVTLGSFNLSADAVRAMNFYQPLTVKDATLPEGASLQNSVITIGTNPAVPEIGDKRIRFEVVPQEVVSIIAGQKGSDLVPWRMKKGKTYLDVDRGSHTAEEMLEQAEAEVKMMTWILRAVGWILMAFGMITTLTPFAVMGDVIPFIGNLIGGGIKLFSLISSLIFSLIIIGIAWVAARPLIGIPILCIAGGLLFVLWKKNHDIKVKKKAAKAAVA